MRHPATILLLPLAFLLAGGCARIPPEFAPVWTGHERPPADLPAPEGFRITPAKAHGIAWDSRRLSLKHVWHIYRDSRQYYVHDTFLGSGRRRAYLTGVRIDGTDGSIPPP